MEPSTATEPLLSCEASEVGAAEERACCGPGCAVGLGAAAEMTMMRVDGEVALDWARAVELGDEVVALWAWAVSTWALVCLHRWRCTSAVKRRAV
jgi:hypothetical protein